MAHDDETTTATSSRISEDWAATILGLVLMALAMLGVITRTMVP